MTKKVWQYGRTGGQFIGEWEDNAIIQVPYTDVPPLADVEIEDQFYIPSENRWKELANGLDREKLDNLETMYGVLEVANNELKGRADSLSQLNAKLMLNDVAIKQENTALKEKADSLAQINSKTMRASLHISKDIAELKKQLNPESEGGE